MVIINLIFFFLGIFSFILYKKIFKKNKVKYIKIKPTIENKKFEKTSEKILREQLDRNYLFFGDEGMNLIRNSTVAVVDCQTLGSNIAVTLARSGVKKLILIDNNKLLVQNYKYHPFAICEDINKDNLDLLNDYIKKLNPNINLVLIKKEVNYDNLSEYFGKENKPDYIVDCINEEKIIQKCKLIKYATDNKIKFISTLPPLLYQNDPTQIRQSKFSLIDNTYIISLILENYKKLYNEGVPDFNLVFSIQEEKSSLKNEFGEINENLFCYGVISDSASSTVLCHLAKFEVNKENEKRERDEIKIGGKTLSEAIENYKNDEIEKKNTNEKYLNLLTYEDFRLISLGFKNESCIKQKPTPKMRFVRWRLYKEPSRDNIVIMGKSEINLHLRIHNENELINFYTKPVVDRVDKILKSLLNKK